MAKPRPKPAARAGKRRRKKSSSSRKIVKATLAIAAVVVVPVALLLGWALLPGSGRGAPKHIVLSRNPTPAEVTATLERAGLIDSPLLFSLYLRVIRPSVDIQGGPHLLNDGLSARDLVQLAARLPGRRTTKVTVPEGFNVFQLATRLERSGVCSADQLLRAARAPATLKRWRITAPSVEGYLFPATYDLPQNSLPDAVLRRMLKLMRKRLDQASAESGNALERYRRERGWGVKEVLTLASLIEKEAAKAEERPKIASVFLNRLTDPSFSPRRLQSDPTSAYGCLVKPLLASCHGFNGRVTPAMNRDKDNPYGTYRRDGLPPGPIANPGMASIRATLKPAATSYLYFVAVGGGRHHFSRTYEEHQRTIQQLRKRRR